MKKIINFKYFMFALCIFNLSAACFADVSIFVPDDCTQEEKLNYDSHPHIVYLIHGLLGDNQETFGDLVEVLRQTYRCQKNLRVYSMGYPTDPSVGNADQISRLHPYDFAKMINFAMINYIHLARTEESQYCQVLPSAQQTFCFGNILNEQTPYSFIVHSQGGLTAMSFLNSCILKDRELIAGTPLRCTVQEGLSEIQKVFQKIPQENLGGLAEHIPFMNRFVAKKESIRFLNALLPDDLHFTKKIREAFKKTTAEEFFRQLISHYQEVGKQLGLFDKQPPRNIANVISLGTPFWGSPVANRTHMTELLFAMFSGMFPTEQIQRLAMGSRGITWQRALLLDRMFFTNNQGQKVIDANLEDVDGQFRWQNPYIFNNSPVQFVNVAGLMPKTDPSEHSVWYYPLLSAFTSPTRYEHDLVVGAPEARIDFIYNLENPLNGNFLSGITNLATKYYPLKNLLHLPLNYQQGALPGIAYIPSLTYWEHPSFQIIKHTLDATFFPNDDKEEISSQFLVEKIKNFSSEIKFYTPPGYHRPINIFDSYVNIENTQQKILNIQQSPQNPSYQMKVNPIDMVRLPDSLYLTSFGQNKTGLKITEYFGQSYFHTGSFSDAFKFYPTKNLNQEDSFLQNKVRLDYIVNLLGFVPKLFSAPVVPSYNSYTEVFLQPYHPFSPSLPGDSFPVGTIELKNGLKRIFHIDHYGQLHSHIEHLQVKGICFIGFVGYRTPDEFRNNVSEKGSKPQYEKLWNLKHWQTFAKNKLWIYKNPTDTVPDLDWVHHRAMNNFSGERGGLRPFTPLEVLGRVKVKLANGDDTDRYMVTSPFIRLMDGVSSFSEVTENSGIRWINVVDLDIASEQTVVPVYPKDLNLAFNKQTEVYVSPRYRIYGNQCLKDQHLLNPSLTPMDNHHNLKYYLRPMMYQQHRFERKSHL